MTVNNDPPYENPIYLVNDILLGDGVEASNHNFLGDSIQIGFFDGTASNLGLNSGIVMSTGDISILDLILLVLVILLMLILQLLILIY